MRLRLLILFLLIPHMGFSYYLCRPCCSRFQLPGWWGSGEYLYLWRKTRFYPALLTTNPTNPPLLSDPTTEILFGDEAIGGCPKSGGRGDLGFWVTPCLGFGVSAFTLEGEKINFSITGSDAGTPILGRPFFNTNLNVPDVELISFPAVFVNGSIKIETNNRVWGLDLYARRNFLSTCCFKFDLLTGFQFNRIIDSVDITSQTTILPLLDTNIRIVDTFSCENSFYGGIAGLNAEWRSRNWAVSVIGKVGIGNMHEETKIAGNTTTFVANVPADVVDAGLLAQPSNIGKHFRNHFNVVPQINANVQLRVWNHFWLSLGYMSMYWQSVALAGEQIDLNVNPNQLPGPPIGPISPFFNDVNKSFWVHGITAGLHVNY